MYFGGLYTDRSMFGNVCSIRRNRAPPTHTEDGVPIRKLYVTNLPPNVSHNDLIEAFGKYGTVNYCMLRPHAGQLAAIENNNMTSQREATQNSDADQGQSPQASSSHTPGYGFVTFTRSDDAHRALCASRKKSGVVVHGQNLIVRPADTWHQPTDVADKPAGKKQIVSESKKKSSKAEKGKADMKGSNENEICPSILDILDHDSMQMILQYLPLPDLIRSERVSKVWQLAVADSLASRRCLSTSKWSYPPTTATLRAALIRCGSQLRELHLDSNSHSLNGRTFKTIAKFCPRLEVLSTQGALESGGEAGKKTLAAFKQLRSLSISSCSKLDDTVLYPLLERDENPLIELTLNSDENFLGRCLTNDMNSSLALQKLSLSSMNGLRGPLLVLAAPRLVALRELHLDMLPQGCWDALPTALSSLPNLSQLQDLSLLRCVDMDEGVSDELSKALSGCTGLKRLRLWYNLLIRNSTLEVISRTSKDLRCLEVCGCRWVTAAAVSDALLRLENLRLVDLSRMPIRPVNTGGSVLTTIAGLPLIETVRLRDSSSVTAEDLAELLQTCQTLRQLDVCGTSAADNKLIKTAMAQCEMPDTPHLILRLARTKVRPEQAPPDDVCHRLRLQLDWRDETTGFNSINASIFECFSFDDTDSDGVDYDGYSDEDGLRSAVSQCIERIRRALQMYA